MAPVAAPGADLPPAHRRVGLGDVVAAELRYPQKAELAAPGILGSQEFHVCNGEFCVVKVSGGGLRKKAEQKDKKGLYTSLPSHSDDSTEHVS